MVSPAGPDAVAHLTLSQPAVAMGVPRHSEVKGLGTPQAVPEPCFGPQASWLCLSAFPLHHMASVCRTRLRLHGYHTAQTRGRTVDTALTGQKGSVGGVGRGPPEAPGPGAMLLPPDPPTDDQDRGPHHPAC